VLALVVLVGVVILLVLVGRPSPTVTPVEPQAGCTDGWMHAVSLEDTDLMDVRAPSDQEAWAVGGATARGGIQTAAAVRFDGNGWIEESIPRSSARDSALVAVDAAEADDSAWAVGYQREPEWWRPLVLRRQGEGWIEDTTVDPGQGTATLTDVGVAPGGGAWAVGFTTGVPGEQRPWAVRHDEGRWTPVSPSLVEGERGVLSGVSLSPEGGIRAAGTVIESGEAHPYLLTYADGDWSRQQVTGVGEASISDIDVPTADDGWAVGYEVTRATVRPLVIRWDGSSWAAWTSLPVDSAATILSGVAATADGVIVTGTTWDERTRRFSGLVARWAGSTWHLSFVDRSLGPSWIRSVDGDPGTAGWVAGVAGDVSGDRTALSTGLLSRTCTESPGKTPATATPSDDGDALEETTETPGAAADRTSAQAVAPPSSPQPPIGGAIGEAVFQDVASSVGLPTATTTWGAVVADFDQDGRDDIFLGRHGKRARLYLDRGDRYEDVSVRFGGGDRHGCAAADVDGSGLPDLYCSFGAERGTAVKGNQLWLDPGGPEPRVHPIAGGAIEPFGRGRFAAFLDVDDDHVDDLVIAQEPDRVDGSVSSNRAYVRIGPAAFESHPLPGFDEGLHPQSMDVGDVDGDGRMDIVLVHHDPRALAPRSGVRLYRNDGTTRVTDATSAFGIEPIGGTERDAALVELDGDGRIDLVRLAHDRLVVSLQRDGRFTSVHERPLADAIAIAAGDADGDGDQDLYVLRQKAGSASGDAILLNDGTGRSFAESAVPAVVGGVADDVVAVDHDQDGTIEFLALNGFGGEDGPLQLISVADRSGS
jgi:FG-GAP-like repeat